MDPLSEKLLRAWSEGIDPPEPEPLPVMPAGHWFGLEEWQARYPDFIGEQPIYNTPPFPWGNDVMDGPCPFTAGRTVKETHFVVLGMPFTDMSRPRSPLLTVKEWCYAAYDVFEYASMVKYFGGRHQPFAIRATARLRWHLLWLAGLGDLRPDTQTAPTELPEGYERPAVVDIVTLLAFHSGGKPLEDGCGTSWLTRDADRWISGSRVVVLVNGRGKIGLDTVDPKLGGDYCIAASRIHPYEWWLTPEP